MGEPLSKAELDRNYQPHGAMTLRRVIRLPASLQRKL